MTTATKRPTKRHECRICGRKLAEGSYTYSPATGSRYCGDWKACDKRAKRKVKS